MLQPALTIVEMTELKLNKQSFCVELFDTSIKARVSVKLCIRHLPDS